MRAKAIGLFSVLVVMCWGLAACGAPATGDKASSGESSGGGTARQTEAVSTSEIGTVSNALPVATSTTTITKVTTTTQKTSAATTDTLPFSYYYFEDMVSATLKEEYYDPQRVFTPEDFPGVDIKSIRSSILSSIHQRLLEIHLNKTGEKEVREAVRLLQQSPFVEEAYLTGKNYTE